MDWSRFAVFDWPLVARGALPRDLGAVTWAFKEDGLRAESSP